MNPWRFLAAFAIPLPFALLPIAAVAWLGAINPSEPEGPGALILVVDEPEVPGDVPASVGSHTDGRGCDPFGAPVV
jgi:hypothetical protein